MFGSKFHVSNRCSTIHESCPLHPVTLSSKCVVWFSYYFFSNSCCSFNRTGRQNLSKFRMSPCHMPYRSTMCLPNSSTMPISTFTFIPEFDALVAGAGGHPASVEVERHIMDEDFMVLYDVLCHKHGHHHSVPERTLRGGWGNSRSQPTAEVLRACQTTLPLCATGPFL